MAHEQQKSRVKHRHIQTQKNPEEIIEKIPCKNYIFPEEQKPNPRLNSVLIVVQTTIHHSDL